MAATHAHGRPVADTRARNPRIAGSTTHERRAATSPAVGRLLRSRLRPRSRDNGSSLGGRRRIARRARPLLALQDRATRAARRRRAVGLVASTIFAPLTALPAKTRPASCSACRRTVRSAPASRRSCSARRSGTSRRSCESRSSRPSSSSSSQIGRRVYVTRSQAGTSTCVRRASPNASSASISCSHTSRPSTHRGESATESSFCVSYFPQKTTCAVLRDAIDASC
jgi:hypothetical protein